LERSGYWTEPESAIRKLADLKADAERFEVTLPIQIAGVLEASKQRARSGG
jgi:hypothetical protein